MTNHLEVADLMAENERLRDLVASREDLCGKLTAELSAYASQNTNLCNDVVLCGMARDSAMAEAYQLRSALTQFIAACDTAQPTSLMAELSMACTVARRALGVGK